MQSLRNGITIILLSLVLVACGSGGGGGGDSVNTGGSFIDPATCILPGGGVTVTITAANAEAVVSEVKGAIQTMLSFANANSAFIDLNNVFLPSNPATVPCDMSGTATLTLTGLNPISAGDQLATNFSSCADMGITLNGMLTGTYNTITEAVVGEAGNVASANNWDFNISGVLDNLRGNDSNINLAVEGDSTANVVFTAAGVDLTSTTTNTILTGADNAGECVTIENANIVSTATNVSTNPAAYSVNVNQVAPLIVNSTELAGAVSAQTPAIPFSGMENMFDAGAGEIDKYFVELDDISPPTGGVLVILGNTSSITMTAMPGGMVQIDVDEDLGMAGFEATIMTTWGAL